MSIKSSIGWCSATCNPVKGRCKGNCWYCYYSAKGKMLDRLKHNPEIRLHLSAFDALPKRVSKKVFLCSTHDLFGSWISENWRDLIFDQIEKFPQHIFQILTKFPENIDREMPDNVHLGVSVTNSGDMIRHWRLRDVKARVKFISFEPLLEDITSTPHLSSCNWIIIGKLTKHGKKYDPKKGWIEKWIRWSRHHNIPIFMKDNLREIWEGDLIQERPQE